MKIVGTKLDNSDYERFEEFCLKDEMTKSEVLRDLIKQYCTSCEEAEEIEYEEKQKEKSKPVPAAKIELVPEEKEEKTRVFTHGKILDDFGNVIGTF